MTKKHEQKELINPKNDLLQETKEEIAKERTLKFVQKWGSRFVFLAIACSIIGFAYISWKNHQKDAIAEKFNIYYSSLDKIKNKETQNLTETTQDLTKLNDNKGFKVLSDLVQAKIDSISDKKDQSIEKYSSLGNNTNLSNYQNYGFIISGFNQLDSTAGLSEKTLSNLNKIIERNSSFKNIAIELKGLNFFKIGKINKAKKEFQQIITNPQTLPRQKLRVEQILSTI